MRNHQIVVSVLVGVLCNTLQLSVQLDSSAFLIYNKDHQKCVAIVDPDLIQASDCDPSTDSQRFRWITGSRILSISHKMCLGVNSVKGWDQAGLLPCDELSPMQKWECRSEDRFAIKHRQLHLNYRDDDAPNIRLESGTGSRSHWVIYGDEDDLCSHGYQEIFTIDGNALGAPCEFPFKYGGHWYAECIYDWGHLGLRFWCATVTDYNQYVKWGFCPTKSTTGWDRDPDTGVFYQRNTESALTWYQARKSCQQQDANLLSITELHEQSYISALTDASGSPLWIGLNSLDLKSGWQWSNGNPFRYLNWASGHPLLKDGMDCAALNPGKASEWESLACSSKLGYICRKGNSTTITPSVEKDEASFCPANWMLYSGHCYSVLRTKRTWDDALSACLAEGANLTSIHNLEEHSFIISQTGYLPTDELWIGLNNQKTQNLFEWSDRSSVTFAKWDVGEPSHMAILREHCVVMKGKEGKWADQTCGKEYGYMCKKKASTKSDGSPELISPGCPAGWIRFSSHCYSIAVEAKTFNEAETACGQSAANLVQVADMYENAFLISHFGLRPEKYLWIGLSNTEHVGTFEWTNKQTVKFTQFNVGMPERHQGCVAMLTGTSAGLWDVISCDRKEKYICKKLAEGVTTTKESRVSQPLSCPSEWRKKDPGNCIRIYINSNENKKTWTEARNYCKDIGGDLASFHDKSETNNLPYIDEWTTAWIGYNLLDDHAGFLWSDGTSSNYENWDYGEPNNLLSREHCAEIFMPFNKWNDVNCETYNNWICQIRLGTTPKPPPTNTPQAEVTITDDGWIQFSGSQYYINDEHLDMEDARTACKKSHSDLVVITSQSERTFLYKELSRGLHDMYYIGLTVRLDKSISWADGSPVVYTAWDYHEPSFDTRDENCVAMFTWTGFWKNIPCAWRLPSICKRSASFVSTTAAPTTVPEGGCSSDWTAFQGKCYKFAEIDGSQDKSWQEARQYCISQSGNLVSILSQAEQAFLTTMMLSARDDVWIGLNGVASETLFLWTDGTRVSFTNWAEGNPVSVPDGRRAFGVEFDCVVMVKGPDPITGMWKVEHCEEKRGFVCKRNTDPLVEVPVTTVAPASYFKLGNNLYKVQAEKMSWDEARRQCKADDADLASVLDSVTQAFITHWTVNMKEPIWIGLHSNVTDGQYRWIDNWFLNYTGWAVGEPQRDQACVYIDTDGTWKTSNCSTSYYSLCKRSPKPQVEEGSHGYAGITVAVVLVIIAAAGLAGFLFYKRPFLSVIWEHAFNTDIELRNIVNIDS
ncbi:macrophage mannose receptor 1-like [Clarias gariepinus]